MNFVTFGNKIAKLRKEKNMTQVELADKLFVTYQAVSNWERGDSMPDIAKLPLLSDVLGVSIDVLFDRTSGGRIVKSVLDNEPLSAPPTVDAIKDVAPILKPAQVDDIVASVKAPLKLEDISALAPFASTELLDQILMQTLESDPSLDSDAIKLIQDFIPFISEDALDRLTETALLSPEINAEKAQEILGVAAPFLSEGTLDKIAEHLYAIGGVRTIDSILPFLSDETLDQLGRHILETEGPDNLCAFMPFLSEETLNKLSKRVLETEGVKGLHAFVPFLDIDAILKEHFVK